MCERLKLNTHAVSSEPIALRTERRVQGKVNSVMLHNRDESDSLLKQAFEDGVSWPIERSSLNALLDLGLTIEQIARYFSVDQVEVRALLEQSG